MKINEDEGTPRSEEQAYEDGLKDDLGPDADPPVELRAEEGKPQPPSPEALEVRNGLIYQGGKVIGKALSDREWFKEEFGEEWQGTDEALTKMRER